MGDSSLLGDGLLTQLGIIASELDIRNHPAGQKLEHKKYQAIKQANPSSVSEYGFLFPARDYEDVISITDPAWAAPEVLRNEE